MPTETGQTMFIVCVLAVAIHSSARHPVAQAVPVAVTPATVATASTPGSQSEGSCIQPVFNNNYQIFGSSTSGQSTNVSEEILSIVADQLQVSNRILEKLDELTAAIAQLQQPGGGESVARDCSEVQFSGHNESGIYTIRPDGVDEPFKVYCDLQTDGGGWTVFQRRENGNVDFYRDWEDYKVGFGNVLSEHWLGNDRIHRLSVQKQYRLRVDLWDWAGNTAYATYTIAIAGEDDLYRLSVANYQGTAGDSMTYNSGQTFSTRDADSDASSTLNCAEDRVGAWWYNNCSYINLNGQYQEDGVGLPPWHGILWNDWKGIKISMKKTEMKIRPSFITPN